MSQFIGPLFVVGFPRSGTKLLRTLLRNHSKVEIPLNETNFLDVWDKNFHKFGDLSDYNNFLRFYVWTRSSTYFYNKKLENGIETNPKVWYDNCENFEISGVFKSLIKTDLSISGKVDVIWGDKSPRYIEHITLLKKIFPESKIIHIHRDVKDCSISSNKVWKKSIYRNAQKWNNSLTKFIKDSRIHSDSIMNVKFANLINNPNKELKEICNFINVPFEKGMSKLSKPVDTKGFTKGKLSIQKDNIGNYKDKLTFEQLSIIESISDFPMRFYNYKSTMKPMKRLSSKSYYKFFILDILNRFKFDAAEYGLFETIKQNFSLIFQSLFLFIK